MSVKIIIYMIITFLVFYAMDGINLTNFFKKQQVIKARICYFLFGICMTYLLTNFIYDIVSTFKVY